MVSIRLAPVAAVAALLLAACSTTSTTTSEAGSSPAAPAGSASACDDFSNALERTATQFAYLKVAVGSDLDETERLATLTDYTGTLAADAQACAPEAAASLASLRDQTVALAEAYVPEADGAVAEGIFTILMGIRSTGEQAWAEMGRPIGTWKELPLHEDGSTLE
jgi:hypothetical protein